MSGSESEAICTGCKKKKKIVMVGFDSQENPDGSPSDEWEMGIEPEDNQRFCVDCAKKKVAKIVEKKRKEYH